MYVFFIIIVMIFPEVYAIWIGEYVKACNVLEVQRNAKTECLILLLIFSTKIIILILLHTSIYCFIGKVYAFFNIW